MYAAYLLRNKKLTGPLILKVCEFLQVSMGSFLQKYESQWAAAAYVAGRYNARRFLVQAAGCTAGCKLQAAIGAGCKLQAAIGAGSKRVLYFFLL